MASELKPHTPLPWVASVDFVCKESDVPGAKATPVADFQWADDAHYATKAVNMHERLVDALRNMLTADIVNVGYVQALLNEAADD